MEILITLTIIAFVIASIAPTLSSYTSSTKVALSDDTKASVAAIADQTSLMTLNEALNRYQTQGGDVKALTTEMSAQKLITLLKTPIQWNGFSQQFLNTQFSLPAGKTLSATGVGASFRLTGYGSYSTGQGTQLKE